MSRQSHDQATLRQAMSWMRLSSAARICLLALGILSVVAFLMEAEDNALRNPSYSSGYVLYASLWFLAAYNLRKKIPTLPLGSSRLWMQLHLAVGWAAIGLLFLHVGWSFNGGGLELLLFSLFCIVAGSGVFGLYLTKTIPKRLAALPTEVVYEQIPFHRREVASRARAVAVESATTTDVIASLYQKQLAPFFESPRSFWYFVRPTGNKRRTLQRSTDALDRFLSDEQRKQRNELRELVMRRDDLDFQHALQLRLKLWLFAHIGFTYSLIIIATIHGIAVHAFNAS